VLIVGKKDNSKPTDNQATGVLGVATNQLSFGTRHLRSFRPGSTYGSPAEGQLWDVLIPTHEKNAQLSSFILIVCFNEI